LSTQYRCGSERRRQAVRDSTAINGIDYLEVSDDQEILHVHFFHDLPAGPETALRASNLVVEGGSVSATCVSSRRAPSARF
jgi:hypothetical protein